MLSTARALYRINRDLQGYLPPRRHRQFTRAWLFGNGVLGPARRAVMRRRLGYEPPRNINVSLTDKCNLRCRGCYASAYPREVDMPVELFHDLVMQARHMGTYTIGVLGGEPFGYKAMFPAIACHRDVAFRISTNGTLVDDECMAFLADNGHVLTFVSLEGTRDQTDAWRGAGVYANVADTMDRLREARVLFGFSATMHRGNTDVLISREFLAAMRDLGARFAVYFTYGPVGCEPLYDMVLGEAEHAAARAALEHNAALERLILKIEGHESLPGSPYRRLNGPGCQAGRCVHITPTGQIEPCNAIQFSAANAFEMPLAEALAAPFYREIRAATVPGRCLGIRMPDRLLGIVDREQPEPCHDQSRVRLEDYVRDHATRVERS